MLELQFYLVAGHRTMALVSATEAWMDKTFAAAHVMQTRSGQALKRLVSLHVFAVLTRQA